ncbi:MAG: DUF4328 domain-containing protein [Acidimicrobiia bacterium]
MTNTFGDPARLPEPPPAGPFSHGRWASPIHPLPPERSARGVATGALVTLSLMALLSLALAAARLNRATVLDDVRDGSAGFSAVRRLEDADGVVNLATGAWALGAAATAIVFVAWQHLHALNARALARGADGLGPGWAIGGWFIPVANLVIPAAQIAGANRAVEPYVPVGPQHRPGAGTGLVVWWAVPFGLATVVDRVAWILHPDLWRAGPRDVRRVLSEAAGADRWAALAALLFVVAAIAAMVMVWRLTARQDAAIGNVQHLVLAPPPADGWRPPAPRPPRGPRRHRRPPPGGRGRGRRPAARRAASGRPRRPGPSRPSWRGRGAGARPGP